MKNITEITGILEDLKSYVNDEVHPNCEYYIYLTLMDFIFELERIINI